MKKTLIALSLVGFSAASLAATTSDQDPQQKVRALANPDAPSVKIAPSMRGKTDFGSYRIVKDAVAVPSRQAGSAPLAQVGEMAVVRSPQRAEDPRFSQGSVVRNMLTGDYGYATGNVTVAASRDVIDQLSANFGLQVARSFGEIDVYILKAPSSADLVDLLAQVRQTQGVKEARLDIADNINKPQ